MAQPRFRAPERAEIDALADGNHSKEGRMIRTLIVALLAVPLAACAPILSRVPFFGSGPEVTRLAGEWSGEYAGDATGRTGSIVFRLSAAADSAWGDVVMMPRGPVVLTRRAGAEAGVLTRDAEPQPLTIRFVRVEGDRVEGVLEPYRDPECGCELFTTFTGEVRGDGIRGTFVTRGVPAGEERTGRWSVRRRPEGQAGS